MQNEKRTTKVIKSGDDRNLVKKPAMLPCTMYLVQGKWYFKKKSLLGLFICVLRYFEKNIITLGPCRDHIWVIFSSFMFFWWSIPLCRPQIAWNRLLDYCFSVLYCFCWFFVCWWQEVRPGVKKALIWTSYSYRKDISHWLASVRDGTVYT